MASTVQITAVLSFRFVVSSSVRLKFKGLKLILALVTPLEKQQMLSAKVSQ